MLNMHIDAGGFHVHVWTLDCAIDAGYRYTEGAAIDRGEMA